MGATQEIFIPTRAKEYELYTLKKDELIFENLSSKKGNTILYPEDLSLLELESVIPDRGPEEDWSDGKTWAKYGVIVFISVYASLFYKPFTEEFTLEAATSIGLPGAKGIANAAGQSSLSVNVAISIISLVGALSTVLSLPKKIREADWDNYADRMMVLGLIAIVVAAMVGALPSIVFVYDTMVKDGASNSYIGFMLVVQLIQNTAMFIRGGTSVLNIEEEKSKAVNAMRFDMLEPLNNLLDHKLTESQLRALSEGSLYEINPKTEKVRKILKKVSIVMPVLYVLATFSATATLLAPYIIGTGVFVSVIATINMCLAIVAAGLIFMLMSFANGSLIDRLFRAGDSKILDVKALNAEPDTPLGVFIFSFATALSLALLSMGGPAAVVFNYLIKSFPVAYAGGIAGGFPLNLTDLLDLLTKYLTRLFYTVKGVVTGEWISYENLKCETKDEYLQVRMLELANLSADEFEDAYAVKVKKSHENDEEFIMLDDAMDEVDMDLNKPIYSGALDYNASEKYIEFMQVVQSDALKNATDENYSKVKNYYPDRNGITEIWKRAHADREGNENIVGIAVEVA